MLDASAAEAVKRARLQLMLGEPYLATAVTRYRISQTNSPNSVTTMATDGFLIVYNADFVNRRSGTASWAISIDVGNVSPGDGTWRLIWR